MPKEKNQKYLISRVNTLGLGFCVERAARALGLGSQREDICLSFKWRRGLRANAQAPTDKFPWRPRDRVKGLYHGRALGGQI